MRKSRMAVSSGILGIVTLVLVLTSFFLGDFIETYLSYDINGNPDTSFPIGLFVLVFLIFVSWLLTVIFGIVSYIYIKRNKNKEGLKWSIIGMMIALILLVTYLLVIIF